MPARVVITDLTPSTVTHDARFARGGVPRDLSVDPPAMFADPAGMPDLPLQEIADRIEEHAIAGSSLQDIRRRSGPNGGHIPSLDQNGQGFCWAYSTGMTIMLIRARDHMPYVRLSPHGPACKIKNFKNEGGWCGLSARFGRGQDPSFPGIGGYPDESVWPQQSMSRANDNPATWQNAAAHMIGEDWVDLSAPVYEQNLTKKQVLIALVLLNPCACDWYWWGHSTCMMNALVRGNRTNYVLEDFGMLGINSWSDNWGDLGEFEVWNGKSKPDGAICTRVATGA